MKKIKSVIGLLAIAFSCYLLAACHFNSYTLQSFLIQVDSVHIPKTITSNTPFQIDFFGTIGPSDCYSFEKFYQASTVNNEIFIEAWGRYESESNICLTTLISLNQHLDMTIPSPGTYSIIIRQPDGNDLFKQVTVN